MVQDAEHPETRDLAHDLWCVNWESSQDPDLRKALRHVEEPAAEGAEENMESGWAKEIQDIQRQYDIRVGRAEKKMELARSEIRRARNEVRSAWNQVRNAWNEVRNANRNTVLVLERLMSLLPDATPAMVLDQLGIKGDQRDELLWLYDEHHEL